MRKSGRAPRPDTVAVSRKNLLFILACLILILIKHVLASQLPISARPSFRTDDHLMVMMARNILRGKWLGGYSYGILMKGCFFPLFLSGVYLSGFSYLSALDLLNAAAALYFTLQLKPVLRRRRWLLILFAALLFNPVNASDLAYERVYRCSLTNMQTLFLFGSVIGAYLDRRSGFGRQLIRAAFCGLVLWSAWNTREDAMWMLPFVLVAGIVMLIGRLKAKKGLAGICRAVILFVLPFALLLGGNGILIAINQRVYGLPIRNEASAGFGEMLQTMYGIKDRVEVEYVSVSAEKLERMYAVSPTLSKIKEKLTKSLAQADAASDRTNGDGEVEDGWFYWCVRRAAEESGVATTLPEADAFYRQVTRELRAAIQAPDSAFETRSVMPSPLMSPWREGYLKKIVLYTLKAADYMIKYDEVSAAPRIVTPDVERMSYLFEGITGNAALHSEEEFVRSYRKLYIDRADAVASVYQAVNPILAAVSAVLFFVQAAWILIRKNGAGIPWLLVMTGVGLSIVALLLGIAYTDMTAFIAIRYTYMTGGHALMLAWEWGVILRFAEEIAGLLKARKTRKAA